MMIERTPEVRVPLQRIPYRWPVTAQPRLDLIGLIALLAFFLFHSPNSNALAATYYVSTAGSDSNPGSSGQPWRTIQKAANTAAAGDTVTVRAGTYHERVQINVSGTASQPITFQGERGSNGQWLSIIDGGNPVSGWVSAPEVGSGVYKTTSIGYEPYSLTVDDKTIWRINSNSMNGNLVENAGGTGFDALARRRTPSLTTQALRLSTTGMELKPFLAIAVGLRMSASATATIPAPRIFEHLPGPMTEYSSPMNGSLTIYNRSNIRIKGFWIRGARIAVLLYGSSTRTTLLKKTISPTETRESFSTMARLPIRFAAMK